MSIDSYEAPGAESLLLLGRERHAGAPARRLLVTEAAAAAVFLAGAAVLALGGSSVRSLSLPALIVTVASYIVAEHVRYPVGSGWTAPTELVFVPMLFVLPTPLVPLVVAACSVADQLPYVARGQHSPARVLARIADSSYALGPALVLMLFHAQRFSWSRWPVLLLAFLAQIVVDAGAGYSRTWFAEGIRPSRQIPMLWLYGVDLILFCVGLLIAASAVHRPGLVLLTVPLLGLLWLFARERRLRLDYGLALSSAYRGIAALLGSIVEADDDYTGAHSRDVVDLSRATAGALGLGAAERRSVEFVAMLHDVGKISVPKEIINKPGKLDDEEMKIIRLHTVVGEHMLMKAGGALASVARYVRAHHERYDGHGYPDGLVSDQIPIQARIVSVCDAYSAMTTTRPYRAAMSSGEALHELRRCAGSQFDPGVVNALEHALS